MPKKKKKKLKKYYYGIISSQNSLVGQEREKIKIIVSFRSFLTHNLKFQKNCKKIKKMPVWLHLKPEYVGKGRERKKINIVDLFRSYPTRNRKFQKNSKKIQKK